MVLRPRECPCEPNPGRTGMTVAAIFYALFEGTLRVDFSDQAGDALSKQQAAWKALPVRL